jgi:hypothetical protein
MLRPLSIAVAALSATAVQADTITIESIFGFRDVRGVNSIGLSPTDRITYGVGGVQPVGTAPNYVGTTAVSRQGNVEAPLLFNPSTTDSGEFVNSIPYDPNLTGPWEITINSPGLDPLVVSTPDVGNVGTAGFVSALKMSGPASAPTFTWENPSGIDDVSLQVWDLTQRNQLGLPDRIFREFPGTAIDSFTIPDGVLQDDRLYSFGVHARIRYPDNDPKFAYQTQSQSRTFFDFATFSGLLPESYYLPVVDSSSGNPVFNFDNPVVAGLVEYYDPIVAIGYDYMIGEGDPLFNSVIMPNIGDGEFALWLFDGLDYAFEATILAEEEYFFADGVDRFRILGIDPGLGLDPNDPLAFATGLSFVADGWFTGTMTPITLEVPGGTAVIPLPAGLWLGLSGLGILGLAGARHRRARSVEPA